MNAGLMAQLELAVEGLHADPRKGSSPFVPAQGGESQGPRPVPLHAAQGEGSAPQPQLAPEARQRDAWTNATRRGFVEAALRERVLSGLLGLWARVGTHARLNDDERAWLGAGERDAELRDLALACLEERDNAEPQALTLPGGRSAWALALDVRAPTTGDSGGRAILGRLLATFDSRDAALAAREALDVLAADLAFGLRFIRVARERHAFLEAAGVLAGSEPEEGLWRIAQLAQKELRADGFKVYLLRSTPGGVRLQTRLRTDIPGAEPDEWALDADIGITDWVVVHDNWFLVTNVAPDPVTDERWLSGLIGGGRTMRRKARPELKDEPERKLWFLPLRFGGRVLGVICPWRSTAEDFDPGSDLPAAEQASQLLAAACRALVDDEVERRALNVEPRLDEQVDKAQTPAEIYTAWAEAAAEIGGAAGSVLLLKDVGPDGNDPPVYYCAARANVAAPAIKYPCALRFERNPDEAALRARIRAALGDHATEMSGLQPREPEVLLDHGVPAGVVVLFDRAPGPLEARSTFDDDVRRVALRRFVGRRDRRFLRQATDDLKRRVLAAFPRDHKIATLDVQRKTLLEDAAKLVKRHTGADHVRLYTRVATGFERASEDPPIPRPARLPDGPGPLTLHALAKKAGVHVLDLRDDAEPLGELIQDDRFKRVAEALNWDGVQSWLCEPVVIEGRCVGMFKALTRAGGIVLGDAEERIAHELAGEVSRELSELRQAELPTRLNRLTTECTGLVGKGLHELSKVIVKAVDEILTDFVAPTTRFLAVAMLEPETLSTLAASAGVDATAMVDELQLRLVSERNLVLSKALPPRAAYPAGAEHALGVAIEDAGTSLCGALFVFTAERPAPGHERVIGELARALATLAEGERRWHEWRREVGLFRHAFFSPAQGLASAAGAVLRDFEQNKLSAERIASLRSLIASETESLRLWRDNQRLYISREILPEPHRQGLQRFVERWVQRFDVAARRRRVSVRLEWQPSGDVSLSFDEPLLDTAFSNLLDNAVKYATEGTRVVARVEHVGRFVSLSVEDAGRGIPTGSSELIYELGQRATGDRLRRGDGLGLGLALAKRVAEAHQGTLTHTCEPLCPGPRTDDRRYKVVFKMQLSER